MKHMIVVAAVLGVCSAHNASEPYSALSVVRGVLEKCPRDSDVLSCFKLKAVRLLDSAFKVESLPVFDFVTVEKKPSSVEDESRLPTGDALEAVLPRDLHEKNSALDSILMEKLWSYLNTRTIRMDIPTDVFEGREKDGLKMKKGGKKNGGMYMMMFGGMGAMMMQMALGKLALLAGKALLVSKLALLLAGVLALKSLLSKEEEKHTSQVIYAEPEKHGGWSRNSALPEVAHDLAYWGQRSFRSRDVGTTSSLPA